MNEGQRASCDHCPSVRAAVLVAVIGVVALPQFSMAQKSVGEAWRQRTQQKLPEPTGSDGNQQNSAAGGDVIAYVGERPITRERLINLLIEGHGPAMLDQFIVLEAAEAVAEARGIQLSSADIDAEYEQSLHTIANPTGLTSIEDFDRASAEQMLAAILAERNISRAEYALGMRRNALLRKICDADLSPSEAEIEQQYQRDHGEKVRIRRIVVSTSDEAQAVLRQLGAGISFEELARRFNTNPSAAARDGLMPPFTRAHDEVPSELRATAFSTSVFDISAPFEIDGAFYIIRVEERMPPDNTPMTAVRAELIRHWKERMLPGRMQALHKRLLSQSEVTIVDPTLKRVYRGAGKERP